MGRWVEPHVMSVEKGVAVCDFAIKMPELKVMKRSNLIISDFTKTIRLMTLENSFCK